MWYIHGTETSSSVAQKNKNKKEDAEDSSPGKEHEETSGYLKLLHPLATEEWLSLLGW